MMNVEKPSKIMEHCDYINCREMDCGGMVNISPTAFSSDFRKHKSWSHYIVANTAPLALTNAHVSQKRTKNVNNIAKLGWVPYTGYNGNTQWTIRDNPALADNRAVWYPNA